MGRGYNLPLPFNLTSVVAALLPCALCFAAWCLSLTLSLSLFPHGNRADGWSRFNLDRLWFKIKSVVRTIWTSLFGADPEGDKVGFYAMIYFLTETCATTPVTE